MWEMKKKWESEAREDQWSLQGLNEVVVISKKVKRVKEWEKEKVLWEKVCACVIQNRK